MSAAAQTLRMRPLGGSSGWPTATEQNVSVTAEGIELPVLADGSRGLGAANRTLGGLIAPPCLAVGPGESAYVLAADGVVTRFDPVAKAFVALPGVLGRPSKARTEIAVDRRNLAVVEAGELRVYELGSLAIVEVFGRGAIAGVRVRSVVLGPGGPIALDRVGRLWRRVPAGWHSTQITDAPRRFRRIALDRSGGVHVLAETDGGPRLLEIGEDGGRIATVRDPREVADRFDPAPAVDAAGRFSVPFIPFPIQGGPAPARQAPMADPPAAVATHERAGSWTSGRLDSGIHRCRWHRVEIAAGAVPAGTTVRVSTACGDEPGSPAPSDFAMIATLRGPLLPGGKAAPVDGDALIGQDGRYLWVRLELAGNGSATPRVDGLKLHYPRASALDDLPAVFSADAESRALLERMLAVFETTWDDLEARIGELPRWFDPATIPEGETRDAALRRLATWLAVRVEGDWSADHLRRAVAAEGGLAPRRGTLAGLREAIRHAVAGLPGAPEEQVGGLPELVEGYTQRERLVVGSARNAGLTRAAPLAGFSEDGRLRLGTDRLGSSRVMGGPSSPEAELLARHAHRFSVSLPAAWVQSEAAERMLRRAIDAERPAHVAYDLCLVEPLMRVGVQSAIGIDTIVAGRVRTVLTSGEPAPGADLARQPPQSRQAHGRLGLDAVLAGLDDLPDRLPGAPPPRTRRAGLDAVLA